MLNIVRPYTLLSISLLFFVGCSDDLQSEKSSGKTNSLKNVIKSYVPPNIDETNSQIKKIEEEMTYMPYNAELHHELGFLYMIKGEKEKVFLHLIKATEMEPYNTNYWHSLGQTYLNYQDYEEAKKCFLRMISIEKFNSLGYYLLGLTFLSQGDVVNAEKNFALAKTNLSKFGQSYQMKYGVPYDIQLLEKQISAKMKDLHELKKK